MLRQMVRNHSTAVVAENGFVDAVGNTPLIKLVHLSKATGRNIYGKAEFQNPGGSVKDRAALYLVQDAEKKGQLKPGGTIVEGSAGNTAIGLAHIARARGYKSIFYMPNTQSKSKIDLLKFLGAEVYPVPPCPISDPLNFNNRARDHAAKLDNAVWTNQFDNLANKLSHYETTGPEIFSQLNGKVDGFTCSTGSGGTLAGIARYLYEASQGKTKIVAADPPGSVIYSWVKERALDREGGSFTEGIGQGRITDNLKDEIEVLNDAIKVEDSQSIRMIYELLDSEGLYVGGTSALNVVAAVELAKTLPEGSNVVTILADSGHKYADRVFSKKWLQEKGLLEAIPENLTKYITLE